MIKEKNKVKTDLNIFLLSIVTLVVIGIIFIYSSSSVFALEKFGSPNYFVKKQIIGLAIGLIGLIAAYVFPLDFIKKMGYQQK